MNMGGRSVDAAQSQFAEALIKAGFIELERRERVEIETWLGIADNEEMVKAAFEANRDQTSRTLKRAFRRKNVRNGLERALPRVGKVAVCALLVFYVGLTVAVATIGQVRESLYRYLVSIEDEYTELNMVRETSAARTVPPNWGGANYPSYIPAGLELTGIDQSTYSSVRRATYKNNDGTRWLVFAECVEKESSYINTEGAAISWEEVNGSMCMFADRGDEKYAAWSNAGNYYYIWTDGACDELVRIVQNVMPLK